MSQPTTRPQLLLITFAISLMLSAALIFNLQPMVGKMLLPRVGGSPYSWNVVMAFFQLALLGGYLLAHLLSRLSPWQHGIVYFFGLAAAATVLPIQLPADWQPDTAGHVSLAVLYILTTVVAIPFIALSLSAPTLQRLFSASSHARASDPYFLYVASNFGSFAGLLLYPFLFEPLWSLGRQTEIWRYGFYILMAVVAFCLFMQRNHMSAVPAASNSAAEAVDTNKPGWTLRGQWLLYAFIPSSLTLGVTTFITSDVTAAPLLWVLTLALYLITFMIAFTQRGESVRRWGTRWHLWFATAAVANTMIPIVLPWPVVVINLIAFFTTALACHTRLAQLRPDARHLTEFYLWLSIGGALGGSFNAFVAPVAFNYLLEYPLVLILAIAMHIRVPATIGKPQKIVGVSIWIFLLGFLSLLNYYLAGNSKDDLRNILLIPLLATIILPLRPYKYMIRGCAAIMLVCLLAVPYYYRITFSDRSFFGVIITTDYQTEDGRFKYRMLQHGTTTHGVQYLMPDRKDEPTAYYARGTALANIWTTRQPQSVAVMGLGTGSLNCIKQPGQFVHYFEIDPLMVKVANEQFSFLRDCGQPEVTLGDGRLELAKDNRRYDLIIIDVFSSDSIPTHIITKEAIQLYMNKLNPGGVLGFHISNRFFDLEPVLAAAAKDLGLYAAYGATNAHEITSARIIFETHAVVMSATPVGLQPYLQQPGIWRPAQNPRNIKAWTDDYFNILAAIK